MVAINMNVISMKFTQNLVQNKDKIVLLSLNSLFNSFYSEETFEGELNKYTGNGYCLIFNQFFISSLEKKKLRKLTASTTIENVILNVNT